MKKIILIFFIFSAFTSLMAMQRLTSLSQLKENNYTFLVLERNGCPWCSKYKSELEFINSDYEDKIKFYKVKNNDSKIIYEIYGYQTLEYIEDDVLKEIIP